MNATKLRVAECRALLARAARLSRTLEPAQLAWRPRGLGFGTLGAQFRHIIAYCECFVRGVDSGRINYDDRARNFEWEHDPAGVAAELERIGELLPGAEAFRDRAPVEVLMDEPSAAASGWTRSSLGRELRSLASHTIHHLALIELMLHGQGVGDGFEPAGGELGLAPSTPRAPRMGPETENR